MAPLFHYCAILLPLSLHILASNTQNVKIYSTRPLRPFELTLSRDPNGRCTVLSLVSSQPHRLLSSQDDVVVISQQLKVDVAGSRRSRLDALEILRLIGFVSESLWKKAKTLCVQVPGPSDLRVTDQRVFRWPHTQPGGSLQIYPLEVSGPSTNRVDLTFFSDGYALDEKEKFLMDAKRLASDMSRNQTFATVQPLMNFWAVFVPSRESGIGVGGIPKDTAFGLYRNGTELRAVYCSKMEIARQACLALRSQCDHPILLGNDPLYGGLGGEFTISTASELNGALVLRHELGHSIIGVGEEYDGGFAYFGVNAAQNISKEEPFPWSHWLSPLSRTPGGYPRKERAVMNFQSYPWTMLNKTEPWSATFESSGLYASSLVRFSLSGIPNKEDLKVTLDDKDLGWEPRTDVKLDRWHYDIKYSNSLAPGSHNLSFILSESGKEGTAQLCSAEIIEYGDENEFNSTIGYYGAFPTFSDQNTTTFRPTNEQCLMRRVTSPEFCDVCLEGLWMSLLKRVSLIDIFTITTSNPGVTVMDLTLVPFGQVGSSSRPVGELYTIQWTKDGVEVAAFANMTQVAVAGDSQGIWRVDVQLHTGQVRVDPNGLLKQWAIVKIVKDRDPKLYIGG